MRYETYLCELQNVSPTLNIEHIQDWLMKYDKEFHIAIANCECRKWSKWLTANEKPFPCTCATRVQDCIFIETYYELNNVLDLYKRQKYFIDLVAKYHSIKNNKEELKAFTNNESLEHILSFDSKIIISLNPEPYEKLVLQLNEVEFEGIIELQEIL
ncbi:hypothetical protein [Flavobacterium flavigenum]|uniref:hypothetical protein n=1 Tax=Flavobacterium flavigenum TaxID=3003258 RepID=UPI0022AC75FF|nr:hypothetical protein [Flavobacterium flavigenum]